MAFLPYSYDDGQPRPWEYLPCGAITPKVGMALVESSGNLAIAAGTNKPTYISMVDKASACTAGDIIPVIRVDHGIVFETTFSADPTGINVGDKVTLHASSGLQVTATTTGGVAEVVYKDANASGAMCRVRF